MAANNDLGSLSYSLNIDISQLPDTIRNVEKQLSGISTVADISTRVDSNQLIGAIKQALMAEDFKLKVTLDDSFKNAISNAASLLNNATNGSGGTNTNAQLGYIDTLIQKLKELETQYKNLPKGADTSGLVQEFSSVQAELNKAGKNLSSVFNKSWADINKMAESTIGDLKSKIKSLEQYKVTIPVANTLDIQKVESLIQKLKGDIKSLQSPVSSRNFDEVLGMDTASLNHISEKLKEIRRLRGEININNPNGLSQINSLNKAEADLLRIQQQRLGANKRINESYRDQSNIVNNLTSKALAYFSVQKAEQFASKLVEIRGEFEKQQIALQNILQSKSDADRLFSQVVDLGLKSPFSIMQLNSYVKQLSAYRIETDQLFDTTKRLADISAGLSVDMGRLILAYGQVRAASVLRGQEVRQFTEAGIPLIEALADQFTKLEGRVVSTNEVFDKISNRLVPFEMVRDVLFEMTDAGGIFFDMQEKLADSVAAKWKNLQDAIDVMYNSIGQDNEGFLKGMAEGLTTMTENWRQILSLLSSGVTTLVIWKTTTIAIGRNSNAFIEYLMRINNLTRQQAIEAIKVNSAWTNVRLNAGRLSSEFKSFLSVNKWSLLIGLAAGMATYIYNAYQESKRLNEEIGKIGSEGARDVKRLTDAHKDLYDKLVKTTEGTVARKEAIDKLNSQFGNYYSTMLTEANALQMLASEYDIVNGKIKENTRLKAQEKAIGAVEGEFETSKHRASITKRLSEIGLEDKDITNILAKANEKIDNLYKEHGYGNVYGEWINNAIRESAKEYDITEDKLKELNKYSVTNIFADYARSRKNEERAKRNALAGVDAEFGENFSGSRKDLIEFEKREKNILESLSETEEQLKNTYSNQNLLEERLIKTRRNHYKQLADLSKEYNNYKLSEYDAELKRVEVTSSKIRDAVKKTLGYDSKYFSPFSAFTDAKSMQDAYKSLKDTLADPTKSDEIVKDAKDRVEALKKVAGELGVNLDPKSSKKAGKEAEDARLAKYKAEIALVKEANGAYKKYLDVLDESNAKAKVEENFAAQFKDLGIDIKYASNELAYYQSISDKLSKGTSKKDVALWNSVNKEIGGTQSEEEIEALKKQWQDLNDLFDLKKEAYALRDMYMQKGVSKDVSESFVKQIYGDIPLEFDNFQDDVSSKLSDASGNWGSNAGKAFKKRFGQEAKNSFLEMLDKFQTTQQKIDGINYKYTQIFKDLETQKGKVSEEVYAGMVANAETAKAEELAAVTATAIQMTDAYQRMFGNISEMSEKELNYLIQKWKTALAEAKRNMDGTFSIHIDGKEFKTTEQQIASFTKKVLASEKELRSKNPFKALQDSIKELQGNSLLKGKLNDELSLLKAERDKTDNPEDLDKLNSKIEETEDELKNLDAQNATTWSKMATGIDNVTKQVTDLANSFISLFEALGADEDTTDTLNDIVGIVGGLGDTASGVARIASGDIIGGLTQGVKGIAGVISSITSLSDRKHEKQIRRLQEAIDASKIAYEQLGRAAAKALGNAEYDTKKLQVAELKRQQQLIQGQIKSEKDKKKTDKDKIKNWEEEYQQLGYEIEDIITEITESLTGNIKDMANEMTNALVEAFEAGDDAQEAMFKSIKNNLKQTISKQFQKSVVDDALEPLFKRMREMLGIDEETGKATNKAFTPEQVKELLGQAEEISEDVMDIFNSGGWKEIFDSLTNSGELSGLSKGIQGLTEDTAQIIEAYLNTIRDVTISIMINSENQLSVLQASQLIQSQILTEVATMSSATVSMNNALRSVIAQSNGDNGAGIRVYIK